MKTKGESPATDISQQIGNHFGSLLKLPGTAVYNSRVAANLRVRTRDEIA
jgi:hypothetical protein